MILAFGYDFLTLFLQTETTGDCHMVTEKVPLYYFLDKKRKIVNTSKGGQSTQATESWIAMEDNDLLYMVQSLSHYSNFLALSAHIPIKALLLHI